MISSSVWTIAFVSILSPGHGLLRVDGGVLAASTAVEINSGGDLSLSVADIDGALDIRACTADVRITNGKGGLQLRSLDITGDPNLVFSGSGPFVSAGFASVGGFVDIDTSSDAVNGSITFTGDIVTTPAAIGSGGAVRLNAGTTIQTSNIVTAANSTGSGGAVNLSAPGSIKTGRVDTTGSAGGTVTITSSGSTVDTNDIYSVGTASAAGDIQVTAAGAINVGVLDAAGVNNSAGGNISLDSGTSAFTFYGLVTRSTSATQGWELVYSSDSATGNGVAGQLKIESGGSPLVQPTVNFAGGQVLLDGANPSSSQSIDWILSASPATGIFNTSNAAAGGKAGAVSLSIAAGNLSIGDIYTVGEKPADVNVRAPGAIAVRSIDAAGLANADGGNITIDSGSGNFTVGTLVTRSTSLNYSKIGWELVYFEDGNPGGGKAGVLSLQSNGVPMAPPVTLAFLGGSVLVDGTNPGGSQSIDWILTSTGPGTGRFNTSNYAPGGKAGNVTLSAASGDLSLDYIFAVALGRPGDVTLSAPGAITVNGVDAAGLANVAGGNITLDSGNANFKIGTLITRSTNLSTQFIGYEGVYFGDGCAGTGTAGILTLQSAGVPVSNPTVSLFPSGHVLLDGSNPGGSQSIDWVIADYGDGNTVFNTSNYSAGGAAGNVDLLMNSGDLVLGYVYAAATGTPGNITLTAPGAVSTTGLDAAGLAGASGGDITIDSGTSTFTVGSLVTRSTNLQQPLFGYETVYTGVSGGVGQSGVLTFQSGGTPIVSPTVTFTGGVVLLDGTNPGGSQSIDWTLTSTPPGTGSFNTSNYAVGGKSGDVNLSVPAGDLAVAGVFTVAPGTPGSINLKASGAVSATMLDSAGFLNAPGGSVTLDSGTSSFTIGSVISRSTRLTLLSLGYEGVYFDPGVTGSGSAGQVSLESGGVAIAQPTVNYTGGHVLVDGGNPSGTQSINWALTGNPNGGIFNTSNSAVGGVGGNIDLTVPAGALNLGYLYAGASLGTGGAITLNSPSGQFDFTQASSTNGSVTFAQPAGNQTYDMSLLQRIKATDTVNLGGPTTNSVTLTGNGTISGINDLSIEAGQITIAGNFATTHQLTLDASTISAGTIVADTLSLKSPADIGSAASPLLTAVNTLLAAAPHGSVFVSNTGLLTMGTASVSGTLNVSSSDSITVSGVVNGQDVVLQTTANNGSILVGAAVTGNGPNGTISLSTNGSGGVFSGGFAPLKTINLNDEIYGTAISVSGDYAYFAGYNQDKLFVVDTASNSVTAVVSLPAGSGPNGIVVSPDGLHAYVTNYRNDTVSIIDLSTNQVTGTISIPGSSPAYSAVSPANNTLYVVGFDGNVYAVNLSSNSVAAVIAVPQSTTGTIEIHNSKLYVPIRHNGVGGVAVIDTTTNSLSQVISLPGIDPYGWGMAIDNARSLLYTADWDNNVVISIDTNTSSVTGQISLPSGWIENVGLSSAGVLFAVADRGSAVEGTLYLVDTTNNNKLTGAFPVGPGNYSAGTFVSEVGNKIQAYVPDYTFRSVSVIGNLPNGSLNAPTVTINSPGGSIGSALQSVAAGGNALSFNAAMDVYLSTTQPLSLTNSTSGGSIQIATTADMGVSGVISATRNLTLMAGGMLSISQGVSLTAGTLTVNAPNAGNLALWNVQTPGTLTLTGTTGFNLLSTIANPTSLISNGGDVILRSGGTMSLTGAALGDGGLAVQANGGFISILAAGDITAKSPGNSFASRAVGNPLNFTGGGIEFGAGVANSSLISGYFASRTADFISTTMNLGSNIAISNNQMSGWYWANTSSGGTINIGSLDPANPSVVNINGGAVLFQALNGRTIDMDPSFSAIAFGLPLAGTVAGSASGGSILIPVDTVPVTVSLTVPSMDSTSATSSTDRTRTAIPQLTDPPAVCSHALISLSPGEQRGGKNQIGQEETVAGSVSLVTLNNQKGELFMVTSAGTAISSVGPKEVALRDGKAAILTMESKLSVTARSVRVSVPADGAAVVEESPRGFVRVANLVATPVDVEIVGATGGNSVVRLDAGAEVLVANETAAEEELIPSDGVCRENTVSAKIEVRDGAVKLVKRTFDPDEMLHKELLFSRCHGSCLPEYAQLRLDHLDVQVGNTVAPTKEANLRPISHSDLVVRQTTRREGKILNGSYSCGSVRHLSHVPLPTVSDSSLVVHEGEYLVSTTNSTRLHCGEFEVRLGRGVVVLVSSNQDGAKIYNLHDQRSGAVQAQVAGRSIAIPLGTELLIPAKRADSGRFVPGDHIGRRRTSSITAGATKCWGSEVSMISLMSQLELLRNLAGAKDKSVSALKMKLLKTTACVLSTTAGHGGYTTK